MNVRLLWPGRTRNNRLAELEDDYLSRSNRFHKVERVVLKGSRDRDENRKTTEEGERFLERISGRDRVVVMMETGKTMSSDVFARFIEHHMTYGNGDLVFLVGGENGFSDAVLARADDRVSLSPMTLTHEWARVLLLEQIYRAFTIIRNVRYQR